MCLKKKNVLNANCNTLERLILRLCLPKRFRIFRRSEEGLNDCVCGCVWVCVRARVGVSETTAVVSEGVKINLICIGNTV